jgi:hypothetical protein
LKKQLTTRAFKNIEEYESIVLKGNSLLDEYEKIHEAVENIENKNSDHKRLKKENPKWKEIDINRQNNILEKELSEVNRRDLNYKTTDDI